MYIKQGVLCLYSEPSESSPRRTPLQEARDRFEWVQLLDRLEISEEVLAYTPDDVKNMCDVTFLQGLITLYCPISQPKSRPRHFYEKWYCEIMTKAIESRLKFLEMKHKQVEEESWRSLVEVRMKVEDEFKLCPKEKHKAFAQSINKKIEETRKNIDYVKDKTLICPFCKEYETLRSYNMRRHRNRCQMRFNSGISANKNVFAGPVSEHFRESDCHYHLPTRTSDYVS